MTVDEILATGDRLGVFFVAVLILVVVAVPLLKNNLGAKKDDSASDAVADALLRRDVADLRKEVDDHEARLDALEKKPRRS